MKSGIYLILNKRNGRFYVGRSIDIRKRVASHLYALRNHIHPNYILQRDWNDHPEDGFIFSILKTAPRANLIWLEQTYLDSLRPIYNIAPNALHSSIGRRLSDETKQKISQANRGKKLTKETCERIRKAKNCEIVCSNGQTYCSQKVAARCLGLSQGLISEVMNGHRSHTHGLTFRRKK